jgi:hypothetical protein
LRPTGQPRLDTPRVLWQHTSTAPSPKPSHPSHAHRTTVRSWRPDRSVAVTTTCSLGDPISIARTQTLEPERLRARGRPASVNFPSGPFGAVSVAVSAAICGT